MFRNLQFYIISTRTLKFYLHHVSLNDSSWNWRWFNKLNRYWEWFQDRVLHRTNKVPLLLMLKRQYYASYFKTDLKNLFDLYLYMYTLQRVMVSYSALGNLSTKSLWIFFSKCVKFGSKSTHTEKNCSVFSWYKWYFHMQ